MTRTLTKAAVLTLLLTLLGGCTMAERSALILGALGAAAGGAIGGDGDSALIGAGIGTLSGYMIGNEMDKARARDTIVLREPCPGDRAVHRRTSTRRYPDYPAPSYRVPERTYPPPYREAPSEPEVHNFPPYPERY